MSILFAEVRGFSSLSFEERLRFRERVVPGVFGAVKTTVGSETIRYVNSWGDAYLLLLSNVRAAVQGAFVFRDEFSRRVNNSESDLARRVEISCSLHMGDGVIKDFDDPIRGLHPDFVSKDAPLTARLEPITPEGRIWATGSVFALAKDSAENGVCWDPIGKRELTKLWGRRNLYDVRKTNDAKLDISLIPRLDESVRVIEPSEIRTPQVSPRALMIFCGPSAVGKDAIASRARGRLIELGIDVEFPLKYTTRPQRPYETTPIDGRWFEPSSKYEFVEEEDFAKRDDIVGQYRKYGHLYGFHEGDLAEERRPETLLICIYGDLNSVVQFRQHVEQRYHRKAFIVLLKASETELLRRLDTRPGFSADVIAVRKREMIKDVARIKRLRFGEECTIVSNSNVNDPDDVAEKLSRAFLEKTGYLLES